MPDAFTVAILTVSDRCSRGQATDTSGPALADLVVQQLGGRIIATHCVPDEQAQIAGQLRAWAAADPPANLILTTGGTGLSPRDVTPEATLAVIDRQAGALMELARLRCYEKTPRVFLSRGVAGILHRSLILNLPGSRRGAIQTLEALLDVLPHALDTLGGEGHHDAQNEFPQPAHR